MPKLTIGRKIWLACAVMAVVAAGLAGTQIVSINRLNLVTQALAQEALPSTYLAGRLNTGAKAILLRMNLHMQTNSAEQQAQAQSYLEKRAKQWIDEANGYQERAGSDRERALIASARTDLETLLQAWRRVLPLSSAHRHQEAFAIYEQDAMSVAEHLDETMKTLVSINKQTGDKAGVKAAETAAASKRWAILILVIALAVGGFIVFQIVRDINGTLRRAVKALAESSRQVGSAASQIAHASQALAEGASEQAASLEETSASSEQVNAMAQQNADHTRSALDLVGQSQVGFVDANQSLGKMVQAIEEINDSSDKISRIIRVIDDIAFQTNILALNAAVEAARAGESGMGFAVVADEVRNLAQRSAQAARDTAALIEESIKSSTGGKTTVEHSAESIRAITASSDALHTLVEEVSTGSQEQARGIQQIAQAITQMEQVTQRTAAHAEESAAAAQELSAQSTNLNEIVSDLYSLIDHKHSVSESAGKGSQTIRGSEIDERLQAAIGAHGLWKSRIREAILSGSSDVPLQVVRDDRACAFGKWLHGNEVDATLRQSESFGKCKELHRRFHQLAGDAMALALDGKKDRAEHLIEAGGDFGTVSTDLTRLLRECRATHARTTN
jgi:methyl-accepting chemotaxis protein/methyl-accepting chemotaxis protein-1 (serine sensor receptor)